jgi:hypothetical protein
MSDPDMNDIVFFEDQLGLSFNSVHREDHFLCLILHVKRILIIVRPTKSLEPELEQSSVLSS